MSLRVDGDRALDGDLYLPRTESISNLGEYVVADVVREELQRVTLRRVVGWQGVFPIFGGVVLLLSLAFYVAAGHIPRFQTSKEPMTVANFEQVSRNQNVLAIVAVTILGYADARLPLPLLRGSAGWVRHPRRILER